MRPTVLPTLVLAALSMASCSSYYFAAPQPTDRRDLRTMPRQLRGAWWSMEDEETPPDYSAPANYTVERKRIRVIETDSAVFIDRVLTLEEAADTTRERLYDMSYSGIQRLDTVNGTLDTAINLILKGGLAYPVDDKGIGRGYSYSKSRDTIRFVKQDTTIHELGHYLRVRNIEKGLWTLNFLDGDQHEARGWWLILIAEHRGDTVYLHSAVEKMQDHPSLIGEKNDKYYFTLDMRAANIKTMLRDSLFAPAFVLVR
ncbi:MAG: hypothetical protein EBZ67_11610 [Chitinophagia bacterium]|nr:hypothetical protein [Chitinophagia bacterium]